MDFHSLARKELQALCKKNKIPANLTNLAMADALSALESVEGLDEIMNQSQSPEKAVNESPSIPRTVNKTSTRRKPIKADPETTQPATRTRRTARKTLDKDLEQENKNVNLPITPAVPVTRRRAPAASANQKVETQEKENGGKGTETAAVQTRTRRQVTSCRKKVDEGSVKQVYSTRHSVRVLEKNMDQMSLKDKGKEEPVETDVAGESATKDVSAVTLEKSNSGVSSPSFMDLLEDEGDLNDDVQENDEGNYDGADDCKVGSQNSDKLDSSGFDANGDALDEKFDESDDLLGEHSKSDNTDEMGTEFSTETENASTEVLEPELPLSGNVPVAVSANEEADQKVSDVLPEVPEADDMVTNFSSENETAAADGMEPEGLPAANFADESSDKVMDDAIPTGTGQNDLESAVKVVVGNAVPFHGEAQENSELHSESAAMVVDSAVPFQGEAREDSELRLESAAKVVDSAVPFQGEAREDLESAAEVVDSAVYGEAQDDSELHLDSAAKVMGSAVPFGGETQEVLEVHSKSAAKVAHSAVPFPGEAIEDSELHFDFESDGCPEADCEKFVSEECDTDPSDAVVVNSNSDSEKSVLEELDLKDAVESVVEEEFAHVDDAAAADDSNVEMAEFDTEGLVDVKLIETQFPLPSEGSSISSTMAIDSISMDSNSKLRSSVHDSVIVPAAESKMKSSVDDTVTAAEEFSFTLPSNKQMNPPVASQFPRPTQSTTPMKSSSMKQPTEQKLIFTDINKENIITSEMIVESKVEKVKKNNTIVGEDISLRKLIKMVKELEISKNKKNNNEEKNVTEVGKTRPALQALPANRMVSGEAKKEN